MILLSTGNLIFIYSESQMIQSRVSWAIRLTCLYSAIKTLEERMLLKKYYDYIKFDWIVELIAEMFLHLQFILKAL